MENYINQLSPRTAAHFSADGTCTPQPSQDMPKMKVSLITDVNGVVGRYSGRLVRRGYRVRIPEIVYKTQLFS